MKIAIISDEISKDFETAVELGCRWGIKDYELRIAWLNRVPYLQEGGLKIIKDVIRRYEINTTALSPGSFKIPLDSPEMEIHKKKLLLDTFKLAQELDTRMIIIFGIERSSEDKDEDYNKVLDIFGESASLAKREGFILAMENEPNYWADTAENTAKIVKDVNNDSLRINWDPANSYFSDETPYPDGYRYVKGYIVNVHIKDVIGNEDKKCVSLGKGEIDWEGQIRALRRDNYKGYLAIETHFTPKVKGTKESLDKLKGMVKNYVKL